MNLNVMVSALKKERLIITTSGSLSVEIKGLAYDSRNVKEGYLFFALKGIHTDGHHFISRAVKRGAKAVFHSDDLPSYIDGITYIKVRNTRTVMAPVSAFFYSYPAKKLIMTGVTGTDGKSTTVSLIHQLLTFSGIKAGFISTVQYDNGSGAVKNHYRQSTPEATEIHKILQQMVDNGCTHAVIEATSHGLSPINNRLGSITFDAAVLTNISHEHLEFHKTIERYTDDKANLFRAVHQDTGACIINRDDPFAPFFEKASSAEVFSYSIINRNADLSVEGIEESQDGEKFTLISGENKWKGQIRLPGVFNIENTLAALLVVSRVLGTDIGHLVPFLPCLQPVNGRMNYINCGQDFFVLVDYAHTPGAFRKLFPLLNKRKKNRLIAVFGSAGERDLEKRKTQGEIAGTYADIIVLTDEDPRGEDSGKILSDIAEGCRAKGKGNDLFIIPDRTEAIRFALKYAQKDDLVILLGKGHENSILYKDTSIPWDEKETAVSLLHELGWKEDRNT